MNRLPVRLSLEVTGVALLLAILTTSPGTADACATPYSEITSPAAADTINLQGADGGAGICTSCLQTAGDTWNTSCAGDQTPRFQVGGSGGIDVSVGFHSGSNPGTIVDCRSDKCACTMTNVDHNTGAIIGATVSLFQSAGGTNCEGDWNQILVHELGHAMGLQEAPACPNRIMGNVFAGLTSADCEGIDSNFLSGTERNFDRDDGHPCQNPPA